MKKDTDAQTFKSELGTTAIVEHHSLKDNEHVEALKEVLTDMAMDLQRVKIVHEGQEYLGSLSVHVFASEVLRQFSFVGINNTNKMTHPVAEAALSKLKQDVNEFFQGKRQKLRSGF